MPECTFHVYNSSSMSKKYTRCHYTLSLKWVFFHVWPSTIIGVRVVPSYKISRQLRIRNPKASRWGGYVVMYLFRLRNQSALEWWVMSFARGLFFSVYSKFVVGNFFCSCESDYKVSGKNILNNAQRNCQKHWSVWHTPAGQARSKQIILSISY